MIIINNSVFDPIYYNDIPTNKEYKEKLFDEINNNIINNSVFDLIHSNDIPTNKEYKGKVNLLVHTYASSRR